MITAAATLSLAVSASAYAADPPFADGAATLTAASPNDHFAALQALQSS
jgi:hypothetical protein